MQYKTYSMRNWFFSLGSYFTENKIAREPNNHSTKERTREIKKEFKSQMNKSKSGSLSEEESKSLGPFCHSWSRNIMLACDRKNLELQGC